MTDDWQHISIDRPEPLKIFVNSNDKEFLYTREYDNDMNLIKETKTPLKDIRGN